MKLRDEMPELDGATIWYNTDSIKKQSLIGNKITLIHFWSVSCELCKQSMTQVNNIRDFYKGQLNVIAVHMPLTEKDLNLEQVHKIAEEHDIIQPIYVDHEHILSNVFNNQYVPAYYVFDKKGRLRHRQSGDGGMTMLSRRINRLLRLK